MTFIVPGYLFKGPPLIDGRVLVFKCNGFRIFLITLATCLLCVYKFELFAATIIYDNFFGLLFWANAVAFTLSIILLIKGRFFAKYTSGSVIKDFFMGTELVPHFAGLKLNFFWLRPSMMLWILINLSFLAEHIDRYGQVKNSMLLYQVFSGAYVVDYFFLEDYVTSTWDIIAERFGFMLVWGDIVFIPFTFSLQAWYLVDNPIDLTSMEVALCILTFIAGYVIFRFSNKQKHDFKRNPKGLIWGRPAKLIGNKCNILLN